VSKHRAFNADRYLDKLQGHEPLLGAYVGLWDGRLELDRATLDVRTFKDFLVNGDGDGKDELLEGLYRIYDLCTDRGHEDLVAACQECGYDPDSDGELPVECLSLKVRVENEEAFNLAYDRNTMWHAERFTIFRGESIKAIADPSAAASRLHDKLAEVGTSAMSTNIRYRWEYQPGSDLFVVYTDSRDMLGRGFPELRNRGFVVKFTRLFRL